MVCHPVQRHRCASRARRASPPGASAASRITMPGVQKSHWLAPAPQNVSAQRETSGNPSGLSRGARRADGSHAGDSGAPSTQTVQHPDCPCGLHPSFAARKPRRSWTTSRSEAPSSAGHRLSLPRRCLRPRREVRFIPCERHLAGTFSPRPPPLSSPLHADWSVARSAESIFRDTSQRPGQPQRLASFWATTQRRSRKGRPATMTLQVATLDGKAIGQGLNAKRSREVPASPPLALTTTLPAVGTYQLNTTLGGKTSPRTFKSPRPRPFPPRASRCAGRNPDADERLRGQSDAHPISRLPAAPSYAHRCARGGQARRAVDRHRAYCQMQVCGAVLELLLAGGQVGGKIRFLHAEV